MGIRRAGGARRSGCGIVSVDLIAQDLLLILGDGRSPRARAVARTALLLAEAGLGRGDILLYQGRQAAELVPIFWASVALGAVFVPLDAGWPDYLRGRAAGTLGPAIVIADEQHLSGLSGQSPEAIAIDLAELGDDRAPGAGALAKPAEIAGSAAAAYLFTSGSTGTPKAVV